MAQLIKGIVDTQKNNYRSIGKVTAGDDLELELEVKMNGQPIEFINPQAELLIKKSDNNRIRQTKDILYQDGKFKIKVDEQGVTYPGIVTCQLVTKENGRVSTCLFYFNVGTSLDREVLQSISKVEVLEELDEYIVQAFANLEEYEKRILAGDETIRKLNSDMNEAEKIRDTAELKRQETFKSLKENMDISISNLDTAINLCNLSEKERGEIFNSLKLDLEVIKQDLIILNTSIELEEGERVQAEINRVNKALEIIEKLESTNNSVATAEAERATEFNDIKSELTSLKEALTTINNIANSHEEVRKEKENERIAAEQQRAIDFEKIKSDNANLGTTLTKKVDDKLTEIQKDNTTFKQEINEQYAKIITKNNEFKEQMNTDFGNAKTDYFGEEHLNIVDRLNSDFDNVHQRINDSSYLAYEGTNITADNSYYGYTKDLSIKGRTLQNLLLNVSGIDDGVTENNGGFIIPHTVSNFKGVSYYLLGKINTTYTIIINVLELFEGGVGHKIEINNGSNGYINKLELGINKFTIRTNDLMPAKSYLRVCKITSATGGNFTYDNLTVLEGDYTNTPLEDIPFGEGIYSVGESEDNLIKIKSHNKNLFKLRDMQLKMSKGVTCTVDDDLNFTIKSDETSSSYPSAYVAYPKEMFEGKKFTLSCDVVKEKPDVTVTVQLSYVKIDGTYSYIAFGGTKNTHTFPNIIQSDIVNLQMCVSNKSTTGVVHSMVVSNLMCEENTIKTDYVEYQESTQELQLTEPLRSLPNGVCDEITEDGTEIRRIGKVVLDGSEGWYIHGSKYNNCTQFTIPYVVKYNQICVSNRFSSEVYNITNDYELILIGGSNNIHIRILKSKLTTQDVTGFKKWLSENPTTVYYELAEPIITKHNLNINLKTFEGTTHITSDNYLLPTLSCKVPSNVQAIIQTLRLDNEELTQELESTNLELEEKTTQLEKMDTDLVATTWDMDYRLCEWEWYLEDMTSETMSLSLNIEENENTRNVKGGNSNMALSRYEQAKIMIVGGAYNKETLTRQLTTYLNRGYVSQEEYDELIALMEAKDLVMEEVQA